MKFDTIKIFRAKSTEKKAGKPRNSSISNKERKEIRASLLQLGNNPEHRHEVKLPIRILHLSTKAQVFRKSRHSSLLHYFYYFQRPCTMK